MRVELFDGEGNRYTVAFEGQITRDKALRLLDLVELLGGMPTEAPNRASENSPSLLQLSRLEKVQAVIQKSFPLVWFSSRDIQSMYEQEMKEPIGLSTVSTYLSRLTAKGFLNRAGDGNNLKYKTVSKIAQAAIQRQIRQG
jgi:predicted transcriptional regulator